MNKKQQLEELVRHIVRRTLKEFLNNPTSTIASGGASSTQQMTPDTIQTKLPTSAELAKQKSDQLKLRMNAMKQGKIKMDSLKGERERYKTGLDYLKQEIPKTEKELSVLRGGNISTIPGV